MDRSGVVWGLCWIRSCFFRMWVTDTVRQLFLGLPILQSSVTIFGSQCHQLMPFSLMSKLHSQTIWHSSTYWLMLSNKPIKSRLINKMWLQSVYEGDRKTETDKKRRVRSTNRDLEEEWRLEQRKKSLFGGGGAKPEDSDDDEYLTIGVQFLRLKPEVSACSFCLDLNALRIDELLILSVGSKWIWWWGI